MPLVQRDHFDYTEWRRPLLEDLSLEEISARAMAYATSQEQSVFESSNSETLVAEQQRS